MTERVDVSFLTGKYWNRLNYVTREETPGSCTTMDGQVLMFGWLDAEGEPYVWEVDADNAVTSPDRVFREVLDLRKVEPLHNLKDGSYRFQAKASNGDQYTVRLLYKS